MTVGYWREEEGGRREGGREREEREGCREGRREGGDREREGGREKSMETEGERSKHLGSAVPHTLRQLTYEGSVVVDEEELSL